MKITFRNDKGEKTLFLNEKTLQKAASAVRSKTENCREQIRSEIAAVRERDPAADENMSDLEIFTLYSGVHALLSHRAAHALYEKGLRFPARALSQLTRLTTGIEIHPAATIGNNVFIDHGSGVVIGETAVVGDGCTIYQGATLGGTGKDVGKRHPTLGKNVMIGAGAKVLGPVNVGDNCKIAAGAVVLKDIPAHSTAVGIPARVVRQCNERVVDLDWIHIPDPVEKEFSRLRAEIEELKKSLPHKETDEEHTENESEE